jgi:hypothetical protein
MAFPFQHDIRSALLRRLGPYDETDIPQMTPELT